MNSHYKIGAIFAVLLVAACNAGAPPTASPAATASADPTPSAAPSATPSAAPSVAVGLDGRTFLSVAITVDGEPQPLVPNTAVRLTFDGGQLSANAGCNIMSGAYTLDGDQIQVDMLAMTEMGCEEPVMDQDQWLADFLSSDPTYVLDGNDLTLTSGTTVMTMLDRVEAEPDQALTGTTWQLTTIFSGGPDGVAVSIPEGVVATLAFNDDGSVNVSPGCNSGSGAYTVEGDTIAFGPIALTRMACAGAAGQVENDVLLILGSEQVQFAIESSSLTLTNADGSGLQFTAQ